MYISMQNKSFEKNKFDIMYIDIEGKNVLKYRIKTFKATPELLVSILK